MSKDCVESLGFLLYIYGEPPSVTMETCHHIQKLLHNGVLTCDGLIKQNSTHHCTVQVIASMTHVELGPRLTCISLTKSLYYIIDVCSSGNGHFFFEETGGGLNPYR